MHAGTLSRSRCIAAATPSAGSPGGWVEGDQLKAASGTRTLDLRFTKAPLYRLS